MRLIFAIPYPLSGTLWEATATDEAIQGSATPIVSNLNARTNDGQTYQALFGVATPEGVNPSTLAQGQKTSGKVYFDVTGTSPNSVVYNAAGQDMLAWVQSASSPSQAGAQWTPTPRSQTTTAPAGTQTTPQAANPVTPAPAAADMAPAPAGSPGTPLPAGSQGTPLPVGSQGTPLPAGGQGTPVPAPSPATPTTTTVAPAPPAR